MFERMKELLAPRLLDHPPRPEITVLDHLPRSESPIALPNITACSLFRGNLSVPHLAPATLVTRPIPHRTKSHQIAPILKDQRGPKSQI